MKKLLFLSLFILSGCASQPVVIEETEVPEAAEGMGTLACMTHYELSTFDAASAEAQFDQLNDYLIEPVAALFEDPTFVELKAKSDVASLCVLDHGVLGFVFYGDFDGNNNAIGLSTDGALVTTFENNAGGGDIGLCHVTGYLNEGMLYDCGGGDGPASHNKTTLLTPEGETLVLKDCEYSSENSDETVVTCSADLLQLQ